MIEGDSFRLVRDDDTATFFDAAAEGRLLVRRCGTCGRLYPPAQRRCWDRDDLEWREVSGSGRLISWTADHGVPLSPLLAVPGGDGASVVGIVELDEGPWLTTPIIGAAEELVDGQPVRVTFVRPGDGEPVPVFEAAVEGAHA